MIIDLNELLDSRRDLLREVAGPDAEVMFRPGDELEQVYADPVQLERVIVDLVLHARSAMPSGGTVETASVDFGQNSRSRRSGGAAA